MVVAGLLGDVLFHQPARGLEIQHEDLRLQQRGLHPLALAGDVALQQRGEDAHGAEQPGGEVGHGNADPHRALAGRAGDRHQPAHALRDLIEAGALVIGAVLAEAGDAAIDDARIDLAHALIVDAELGLDVGAEVLDHHVGLFRQPPEHLEALGVLQVERHRPLVAVQILEVRAAARAARLFAAGVLQQGIDLDDIGAPVRELPHAGRPGADAGQIEHGEAGQGLRGAREGHSEGSGMDRNGSEDAPSAESPRLVMRQQPDSIARCACILRDCDRGSRDRQMSIGRSAVSTIDNRSPGW